MFIYKEDNRVKMDTASRRWDKAPICICAKANLQLAAWPKTGLRKPGSNLVINPVLSARLAAFPSLPQPT